MDFIQTFSGAYSFSLLEHLNVSLASQISQPLKLAPTILKTRSLDL